MADTVKIFDISSGSPVEGTIDASEVQAAVQSGKFALPKGEVEVVSPDGQFGTIDTAEASQAFNSGFKFATKKLRHSSVGEQVKTAAEGFGEGAVGPIAPAIERLAGAKSEDIRAREEANPISHGVGKAAGMLLSPIGKVNAVSLPMKLAVEGALYGASNELSKLVKENPEQTFGTAAVDIGLSGVLGGGLGIGGAATKELWQATKATKAAQLVDSLKGRVAEHMGGGALSEAKDAGAKLADALVKRGASRLSADALGTGMGAAAGHATGIPGGAAVGALLGEKYIAPQIEKLLPSLIKPLVENPTNPAGTKVALEYLSSVAKGMQRVQQASTNLFKTGSQVLAENSIPDDRDIAKLEKSLDYHRANPTGVMELSDHLGAHLPDHAMAMGASTARALQYLDGLRPSKDKESALGAERIPNKVEDAKYKRALMIAEQPLVVLKHIKDGSVTPGDIEALSSVWPEMHKNLQAKVSESLIDYLSKGHKVPYRMVPSLSLFMGMPMDASTRPENILANQPLPPMPEGPVGQPGQNLKGVNPQQAKAMNNLSQSQLTASQTREQQKQGSK